MNDPVNSLIRSGTVIYDKCRIGDHFVTGHYVLIREQCVIGDNVSIGSYTELSHHVTIGDNVRIHSMCFIPEGTVIGNGAWIGPKVCFTNDKFPGPSSTEKHRQGVVVEHDAVIGANVTILPGVCIGHHAFIGAGSVVTKNVPSGVIVAGNPARILHEPR